MLIVQGDWLSAAQERTVVVLPLTCQVRHDAEPLRVTVSARDSLRGDSQVIVEQPRTIGRKTHNVPYCRHALLQHRRAG